MRTFFKCMFVLVVGVLTSCNTLQYKTTTQPALPELGTIGVYADYLLSSDHESKTVVSLSNPVRLDIKEVKISQRELFAKNDSIQRDSTHVSLEVLDKIALVHQMNTDLELLKYLKRADTYELVSQVTMNFRKDVLGQLQTADEVYLTHNKQSTLSLQLRKDNEVTGTVEFSQGTIVSFKTSHFCWGQGDRRRIEIFDLIPPGTTCSEDTYRTARKAEKKNEFKFWR